MSKVILVKKSSLHILSLLGRLTGDFIQEDYILSNGYSNLDILAKRMKVLSISRDGFKKPVYTVFGGGDCSFIISLKDNSPLLNKDSHSQTTDLELLQNEILIKTLGLDLNDQDNIIYSNDIPGSLAAVDADQYIYMFILNT